ncbi:hypothetical protein H6P81_015532 [Aristolochia fimbriata]|uniref:Uncharacterized protein n=1 Tax=Aristolochia fimbriata TaxID=158543 RepID=A0AAV7E9L5_ARIFI|nr:hypothetical protein H6P81_015532 [Aristolochia fimbriata]
MEITTQAPIKGPAGLCSYVSGVRIEEGGTSKATDDDESMTGDQNLTEEKIVQVGPSDGIFFEFISCTSLPRSSKNEEKSGRLRCLNFEHGERGFSRFFRICPSVLIGDIALDSYTDSPAAIRNRKLKQCSRIAFLDWDLWVLSGNRGRASR